MVWVRVREAGQLGWGGGGGRTSGVFFFRIGPAVRGEHRREGALVGPHRRCSTRAHNGWVGKGGVVGVRARGRRGRLTSAATQQPHDGVA
jgi:hypothetical protein